MRVLVKAALLFALLNVIFALINPLPAIGQVSVYNALVPGRMRLPYSDNPDRAYSLSLDSLDAMFASHEIDRPPAADEFRVLVLGDSATWGYLLPPEDTVVAALNEADLAAPDGRTLRFYNLGYPIMSLFKDVLLLDYAMTHYEPDAVVWLVTAESFPFDKQLFPPPVQNNPDAARALIAEYDLALDPNDDRFADVDFFGQTLIGQRRPLADWLRLQLYGPAWAATGIDQVIPAEYDLRTSDFGEDVSWGDAFPEPVALAEADLAFDVLRAGFAVAGEVPVLLVNEPMFISDGENSDLRYNFFYPRWAYDGYHALLNDLADAEGWAYLDLWDALPPDVFTDSPVHYTVAAARDLAGLIAPAVVGLVE